jgi:peptide/nickel transport system substrate-binding protein
MMKKSFVVLLLALSLVVPAFLSAAGGGDRSAPAPAAEKHLIVALNPDYESFDPAIAYEPTSAIVLGATYEVLFDYENDIENLTPRLAESYTVSEDGLSYTFTLRRGVVFVSGNPLTAADIKWSNERAINLKGNGSFRAAGIARIEAPDDYTVVYHLKAVDPTFPIKLASTFFSPLDSKTAIAQGATNAENAATADTARNWLDNNSIGTGPYRLESYTPKVEVILTRNPNYWGKAPYFDRITLKAVADSNSQAMMLRAGDVDIAYNLGPEQVRELRGVAGIDIIEARTLQTSFLLMNRDPAISGPVADPTVQKAIRLALDYPGIQTIAGAGMVTPPVPFPIGLLGSPAAADVRGYPKTAEAKNLLTQAGYPDGFSTKLYVPTTNLLGLDLVILAQKIQNDLAAIGIAAELVPENVTISLNTYRLGQQSLGLWYWNPDYYDNISQLAFLPGNTVGLRANWTAESNPALVSLSKAASVETDSAKRAVLFGQIAAALVEDSPFAVLLQINGQYAVRSGLKGAGYHILRLDLPRIAE